MHCAPSWTLRILLRQALGKALEPAPSLKEIREPPSELPSRVIPICRPHRRVPQDPNLKNLPPISRSLQHHDAPQPQLSPKNIPPSESTYPLTPFPPRSFRRLISIFRRMGRSRGNRNRDRHEQQPRQHDLQRVLWERDLHTNQLATNLADVQWQPENAAIQLENITLPHKNESNVRCTRPDDGRPWELEYIGLNDVNWYASDRTRPGNYNMSVIAEPRALMAAAATIGDLAHASGKGHCILNFQLQDIKPSPFTAANVAASPSSISADYALVPIENNALSSDTTTQRSGIIVPVYTQPSVDLEESEDLQADISIIHRRSFRHETSPDLDVVSIVERRHGLDRRRRRTSERREFGSGGSRRQLTLHLRGDFYDGPARRLAEEDAWADIYPDRLSFRYRERREKENDTPDGSPSKDRMRLSRSLSPSREARSRSPRRDRRSKSKDYRSETCERSRSLLRSRRHD
ncbi:hypothetical protein B0T14DRAFT_498748 [Immersiella caudata]|uniref:Uncharacterized protein n=1 Tax=Immersiella caudata TaxID=314043 RepID=A0AA39WD56_9PEZI|nr:hypothetical protein B0T14DRAFT_498748 [Immersiella caudata]